MRLEMGAYEKKRIHRDWVYPNLGSAHWSSLHIYRSCSKVEQAT